MTTLRRTAWFSVGFGYGILLGTVAFLCAGLGHGTYIPVDVSSAPLSFVGTNVAFLSPPITWGILLLLVTHRRRYFVVGLVIHYLSALAAVFAMHDEWSYVYKVPGLFSLWLIIYVGGQVFVWNITGVDRSIFSAKAKNSQIEP
jgi:hypothetical protein